MIAQIEKPLVKFTTWMSYERFGIFALLWYASYILHYGSFTLNGPRQAWSSLSRIAQDMHCDPEPLFAGLLYVGAIMGVLGMWKNNSALRLYSAFCGFLGFSILTGCCAFFSIPSTGVPAYSILTLFYFVEMIQRSSGSEWVYFRARA